MTKDFCGTVLNEGKCMACEIVNKIYNPPGGIVFEDKEYIIHQDPLVAIPGFLIISPKRHIYSVDEMTKTEQQSIGRLIATAETAIKTVTQVTHLSIIQEDKIKEGHLHIWVFPWHDFITATYDISLSKMRDILTHFKDDLQYKEETQKVTDKLKEYFLNLQDKDEDLNFFGRNLCDQVFSGQDLNHANFRGAILKRCRFERCDLSFANFDDADLYRASFRGATLYSTTFRDADLTRTDFRDANLYGFKVFGADLTHTIFDDTIVEEKKHDYSKAEDIYNTIKRAYSENGNKEESAKYYYKQCVAKRKQKRGLYRFFEWLIADLLIGYGERLGRCLCVCTIVMAFFSCIYFVISHFTDFFGAALTSISVFFGFDPVGLFDHFENMSIVFSIERLIGYLLIALALIGVARKIVRD